MFLIFYETYQDCIVLWVVCFHSTSPSGMVYEVCGQYGCVLYSEFSSFSVGSLFNNGYKQENIEEAAVKSHYLYLGILIVGRLFRDLLI